MFYEFIMIDHTRRLLNFKTINHSLSKTARRLKNYSAGFGIVQTAVPIQRNMHVAFLKRSRKCLKLVEWAKCGEGYTSVAPTMLWTVGAAALTQRLLTSMFRRFLFRRVPLWELVLQNLLFIWMVIYSLHFWVVLVKIIKIFIEYCYDDATLPSFQGPKAAISADVVESRRVMEQWVIWVCGVVPLAVYFHTRPRPAPPPLMIWITTSPWLRREMGPYGYYLSRPFSTIPSTTTFSERQQALTLRKAFSDSNILIKEPPKRKRHSKSI